MAFSPITNSPVGQALAVDRQATGLDRKVPINSNCVPPDESLMQRQTQRSISQSSKKRRSAEAANAGVDSLRQLTFWPDETRGVPNAVLRGALFSISQERQMTKRRQRLATVDGYLITFKGERFNQRDLDLWEMLLHIGRKQAYGKSIEFVAKDLLQDLGRGIGGADYDELKEDISRLMGGVVEITFVRTSETFVGSLIHNAYRDEVTQRYSIIFDKEMRKLYDAGYTHVNWEQRNKLRGNSSALAKWLHGFYATHAAPLPYKVTTIKELCGSTTKRLSDFRTALRAALEMLKNAGALSAWSIDHATDLVKVKRKTSMSQQRHLLKKKARSMEDDFPFPLASYDRGSTRNSPVEGLKNLKS